MKKKLNEIFSNDIQTNVKPVISIDESQHEMTKFELNAELRRVNSQLKKLGKPESDKDKAAVVKLEKERDDILSMLKEEDIDDDIQNCLDEALNLIQRMRRRAIMRRNKSKLKVARARAMRRRATGSVIMQRARRAARGLLARRILRKDKANASYAEKSRVERVLATRQSAIARIARKMMARMRAKEMARMQHKRLSK